MELWGRLRYLWASLVFRNKPVINKAKIEHDYVEEAVKYCPRPYRYMCYVAAKELKISLAAVAARGRDVPTAAALALEDATTGNHNLPRFWQYIATGDPGPDAEKILKKWRRAFKTDKTRTPSQK